MNRCIRCHVSTSRFFNDEIFGKIYYCTICKKEIDNTVFNAKKFDVDIFYNTVRFWSNNLKSTFKVIQLTDINDVDFTIQDYNRLIQEYNNTENELVILNTMAFKKENVKKFIENGTYT